METPLARSKTRHGWAFGISLVALMGLLCLAPFAAEAQSAGKRSATSEKRGSSSSMRRSAAPMRRSTTSLKRSTGSEKKASTTAAKRGSGSFSETSRNGSASSQNAGYDEAQDDSDWKAGDASDAYSDDDGSSDESEAQAALEDFSTRTLGKSCMYGVRGEVIFRPAGAHCRGDAPAAPAPRPAARPKRPKAQKARSQARSAADSPSGPRGSCIIGIDGRVFYAPPGVDCRQ